MSQSALSITDSFFRFAIFPRIVVESFKMALVYQTWLKTSRIKGLIKDYKKTDKTTDTNAI